MNHGFTLLCIVTKSNNPHLDTGSIIKRSIEWEIEINDMISRMYSYGVYTNSYDYIYDVYLETEIFASTGFEKIQFLTELNYVFEKVFKKYYIKHVLNK